MRHGLELAGVRLLKFLPSILPLRASVEAGGLAGILAFDLFRVRRRVTLANLERALGGEYTARELRAVGRRSYVNFARSMVEFSALDRLKPKRLRKMVTVRGREHIDDALSKGKGAIVVTGHFGSWELLGAAAVAHGLPADFLVGEQGNRMVDDLMNELRRSAGIGTIARGVAARGVFSSLKKNRIVAMLSDQDARKAGIFVDFFSTPASTYPGAAQFAFRAGSPIVFCYIVRRKGIEHEAVFLPPLRADASREREDEVRRLTAAHTAALEEVASRYPDHYFWAHRRWKTRP